MVLALLLAGAGACKDKKEEKATCSVKTKCAAGYKCVTGEGAMPVGPLDVGKCEEVPCSVTVPCAKPQGQPCINDLVEACDLHDPNKFCKCVSTTNNQQVPATSGSTPTTGA